LILSHSYARKLANHTFFVANIKVKSGDPFQKMALLAIDEA